MLSNSQTSKYGIITICFCILSLAGCTESHKNTSFNYHYLKTHIWNLDLSDTTNFTNLDKPQFDILRAIYKDMPLFFEKENLYLGNEDMDSCIFFHDTLIILRSYYISVHVTDTSFIGIITKLSADSMFIDRIKDDIFKNLFGEVKKCKTIKFYNDSLLLKNATRYNKISLSCDRPNLTIEIDSVGTIHYLERLNVSKKIFFKGKLQKSTVDSVQYLLSAGLVNRESFKHYNLRSDTHKTQMVIILLNNDTISIDGDNIDYNYRLDQLIQRMKNSIKLDNLKMENIKFKFLANKYLYKN